MGLLRAKSIDDRGRAVELYPVPVFRPWWAWWHVHSDQDPVIDELVRRIKAQVQNEWKRIRPRTLLLLGVMIAVMFGWQYVMTTAAPGARVPVIILFYGLMIAMGLVMFKMALQDTARALVNTFLGEGRCPCCGYSFAGAVPQPDGCVCCTECGAAWRTGRIRHLEPGAAAASLRSRVATAQVTTTADRFWRRILGQRVVLEANGRLIPTVHPRLRGLPPDRAAPIGAERLRRVRADLAKVNLPMRIITATTLFAFAAGQIGLLWWLGTRATRGSGTSAIFFLFGLNAAQFAVYGWFMLVGVLYVNPTKCAAVMVRHGICPGCAGLLDGLEPDAQGRTECAGCGAAWNLPEASSTA